MRSEARFEMDRYFVRHAGSAGAYVFRILPGMRVQVYDVGGHHWLPAPFDPLYRYAINDPDMSVDEIDEPMAQGIIDHFHRRPLPQTAAELLEQIGVSDEPIDRQRRAVYKWLESHDLPDALRHDLARHGLVGPLVGDVPQFRLVDKGPGGWHLYRGEEWISSHLYRGDALDAAAARGRGRYRLERRSADMQLLGAPLFVSVD